MSDDSDKQGWTSSPDGRGSFDILWTCLLTLALCVWSAVHPNISLTPSFRGSLLSRAGLMLIAIVFPEILISSAWKQLRSARWLCARVIAIQGHKLRPLRRKGRQPRASSATSVEEQEPQSLLPPFEFEGIRRTSENNLPTYKVERSDEEISIGDASSMSMRQPLVEPSLRQNIDTEVDEDSALKPWTSEQAFFAVMGGFAIENSYLDPESRTKCTIRRIVTTAGISQLVQLGLITPPRPSEIEERSKADIIAKMFVLSQIIWFGLQVIGRLVQKIPVTPIEIHTAIHVACTIIIYLMWLEKPYDVRSSILLTDPRVIDMGALFNFSKILARLHSQAYVEYERVRVSYWRDRVVRAANNLLDHDPPPNPPPKEQLTTAVQRYALLAADEATTTTTTASISADEKLLTGLSPSALRSIETLKRSEYYSSSSTSSDAAINAQNWDLLRQTSENFAVKEVWGSWSTGTENDNKMSLDQLVHLLFNLLYGGGHLAAWASSSFPTAPEQALWRGSAAMLTSVPLWGGLWVLWWKAARSKRRWLYPVWNGDLDVVVAPLFCAVMLVYFFARAFLLVESLISLRFLPAGAYLSVNWTKYLPHVS